jgi:hypothetical protein
MDTKRMSQLELKTCSRPNSQSDSSANTAQLMINFVFLSLLSAFLAWQVRCQSHGNLNWISPTSPENSTQLQSGSPFTISWNPDIQQEISEGCASCDVQNQALWVTGVDQIAYNFKIGGKLVRKRQYEFWQ